MPPHSSQHTSQRSGSLHRNLPGLVYVPLGTTRKWGTMQHTSHMILVVLVVLLVDTHLSAVQRTAQNASLEGQLIDLPRKVAQNAFLGGIHQAKILNVQHARTRVTQKDRKTATNTVPQKRAIASAKYYSTRKQHVLNDRISTEALPLQLF